MENREQNVLVGPPMPQKPLNITVGQHIFTSLKSHNPYDVLMCEAESLRTITPPEFLRLSIRVAEGLREANMQTGDIVCLLGTASIDAYAVATGTLFLGGVVSPVDTSVEPEILKILLGTIAPKYVFCDGDISDEIMEILFKVNSKATVILLKQDSEQSTSHLVFEDFIKKTVDVNEFQPVSLKKIQDVVAFLVCSSGTRGTPKPVMITHTNLLHQVNVWGVLSVFNKTLSCPAITFSYFYWISGVLLYIFVLSANFEMTIVQKLEAPHVLQVIERHRPIWGLFTPTLAKILTCHPDFKKYNVSSLVLMITGGCVLQKGLLNKIQDVWGPQIICRQAYGLTEVTGSVTISSIDDDSLSVGKLLPGFQMKVVSLTDGSTLGPGREGEIYICSPTIMKGYMKNEEASRSVLIDRWFRTEDIGYYTDTGVVYICGRIKDLIDMGNTQISPFELEEVIAGVSGVIDVGVVGIKVDEKNTLLTALVVKTEGSNVTREDILKTVKEKMPEHKQLRGGVYFVDEIPKTNSGKPKRGQVLKLAKDLYKPQ